MLLLGVAAAAASLPGGDLHSATVWRERLVFTVLHDAAVYAAAGSGDTADQILDVSALSGVREPVVDVATARDGSLLVGVSSSRAGYAPRLYKLWHLGNSSVDEVHRCSGFSHPYCGGWARSGSPVLRDVMTEQGWRGASVARLRGHGRVLAVGSDGAVPLVGESEYRPLLHVGGQNSSDTPLAEWSSRLAGVAVQRYRCTDQTTLRNASLYVSTAGPAPAGLDDAPEANGLCSIAADFAAPLPQRDCFETVGSATDAGAALGTRITAADGVARCPDGAFAGAGVDVTGHVGDPAWDWFAELEGSVYFRYSGDGSGVELWSYEGDQPLETDWAAVQTCQELPGAVTAPATPPTLATDTVTWSAGVELRASADGDLDAAAAAAVGPLLSQIQQRQGLAEAGWEVRREPQGHVSLAFGDTAQGCRYRELCGAAFAGPPHVLTSARSLTECSAECCARDDCAALRWDPASGGCELLPLAELFGTPAAATDLSGSAGRSYYRLDAAPRHQWTFESSGTRDAALGLHLTASGMAVPGRGGGGGWELPEGDALWAEGTDADSTKLALPAGSTPWTVRTWVKVLWSDSRPRCLWSMGDASYSGGQVSVCFEAGAAGNAVVRITDLLAWNIGRTYPGDVGSSGSAPDGTPVRPPVTADAAAEGWHWLEVGYDGESLNYNFDCATFGSKRVWLDLPSAASSRFVAGGVMQTANYTVSWTGGGIQLDDVSVGIGYARTCEGVEAVPDVPLWAHRWAFDNSLQGQGPGPSFNLSYTDTVSWVRGAGGAAGVSVLDGALWGDATSGDFGMPHGREPWMVTVWVRREPSSAAPTGSRCHWGIGAPASVALCVDEALQVWVLLGASNWTSGPDSMVQRGTDYWHFWSLSFDGVSLHLSMDCQKDAVLTPFGVDGSASTQVLSLPELGQSSVLTVGGVWDGSVWEHSGAVNGPWAYDDLRVVPGRVAGGAPVGCGWAGGVRSAQLHSDGRWAAVSVRCSDGTGECAAEPAAGGVGTFGRVSR